MKKSKRKHTLTLLEIMIVIFLIGIIGSVVAYNMKGSLEEGKAFKTKEGARRVHDLILLEMAKRDLQVITEPNALLKQARVGGNIEQLLSDGWGNPYQIEYKNDEGELYVVSEKYIRYMKENNKENDIPDWMQPHSLSKYP